MENKYKNMSSIYNKRYRLKNLDKLRTAERVYSRGLRSTIFNLLGDKCFKCGFFDKRALQIDHVFGDGHLERSKSTKELNIGSKSFYKRVLLSLNNNEGRYQLLCANCNWIKRHENKEHNRKISDNKICSEYKDSSSLFSL